MKVQIPAKTEARITRAHLEKRNAAGEVFEEIEIAEDGKVTVITQKPGEPASSYYRGAK